MSRLRSKKKNIFYVHPCPKICQDNSGKYNRLSLNKKLEKVYKICLESGKPYAGKLARTVWWKSKRCQLNSLLLTNERFNNGLAIRSNYTAHVDFAFNSLEHEISLLCS